MFTVDLVLALDISFVSEIIDRPSALLRPPYALDFVDGILNLRGELITLINPRVLYALPKAEVAASKVLIFHMDDKKYGIVVDSIDEIVTTQANQLLELPTISQDAGTRIVSQDLVGLLQRNSHREADVPVMVLDAAALIARCIKSETV